VDAVNGAKPDLRSGKVTEEEILFVHSRTFSVSRKEVATEDCAPVQGFG
jgi:hypothetical protein